ncbi:unnamed protein product [Rotaria sordida]|uniref:B box-type domain-containing protein n=1 Tax=Rotaria sordida TaxID=392033 RepID=A0A818T8A7_9BILA|nr:unnamed protein product [Rotaria sordida]CAF1379009.1 unnamed protein product [Rotaria sordida]CAF3679375.1 unnamed protein product [Rotaria sordida]CAF3849229.1 unnamed protein product [Rotaria sordida]
MKQNCIKCKNFDQIFICDGCQQSFCNEHINEHHEELSRQMNDINKDYHHFKEDLNNQEIIQSYLSRIDLWERESIKKIQETTEKARNDLLKIFDRMKNQLNSTCDKINYDIQSKQESKNYSEINLNKWIEQLEQLRHIYKTSFQDDIIDDKQLSIRLIKIIDKNQSFSIEEFHTNTHEKFKKTAGEITLSQDHLTATCSGKNWNGSNISGNSLYSFGIHSIRFRITKQGKNNPFFGITSFAKELNPWNRKTPFAYGWWKFPLNTNEEENIKNPTIQTDDEVTLTLDCINSQIQFEHHRTKQSVYQSIEHEQCPFPWKIAIVLYSPGDAVSIIS